MTPVLAAAAAAVAGGCGGQATAGEAERVVEEFYGAVRAGDGDRACRLLSAQARSRLESQTSQACDGVITRLRYSGGDIVDSHVFITNARVRLRSGERAFLGREDGRWRLDAIGCNPPPGDPREQPADCELEA
ncbi:MAG TPA: hypothetical protein VM266_01240 [Solirubrobacteraceae bacterium]|nr:hypothetical protein [Solirubrobacteraceae bacterium]